MDKAYSIELLADHPELVEKIATAVYENKHSANTEDTLQARIKKYRSHLNRDGLPIAWIAFSENEVMGIAALRLHDLPDRLDISPWLAGVFVVPEYRNRRVGRALCQTVESKARSMPSIQMLYLYTLDKQSWYESMGWVRCEHFKYNGENADIMHRDVS